MDPRRGGRLFLPDDSPMSLEKEVRFKREKTALRGMHSRESSGLALTFPELFFFPPCLQ